MKNNFEQKKLTIKFGEIDTMDQFLQTLMAKGKFFGTQCLLKILLINFIVIISLPGHKIMTQNLELFTKPSFDICPICMTKKASQPVLEKSREKMLTKLTQSETKKIIVTFDEKFFNPYSSQRKKT